MKLTIQQTNIADGLQDFDAYIKKLLKDWNAPGVAIGIVAKDKLVFAKGYGDRNYAENLPFTPKTLFPIGSNTKLFTAIAAGILVEEGKLTWDKPIRDAVPTIRFYNNDLNNLEDISHWLIALMNDGKYLDRQVIPANILQATLEPAIADADIIRATYGWWELLNPIYGMGRGTVAYRGHLLTYHGGAIDGFHSQISFLPQPKLGVVVFAIGDHCASLSDIVTYNVYERLLDIEQTPWSDRWLDIRLKTKQAGKEARSKAGADRVANTNPSHPLGDYVGAYAHPAYGILKIAMKDNNLQFNFGKINLPLTHFHYDRFDTTDDERYGKRSVNFLTNPQGDIDRAAMSISEAEEIFTRQSSRSG